MNFDYTDDQKFLKAEARKFLDARCPPSVTRARCWTTPATSHDAELWQAVVEMGWTGAAIPEAYGGLGLGHVELCGIAEELGRVVAPIPFASTVYVFAEAVLKHGDEAQKAGAAGRGGLRRADRLSRHLRRPGPTGGRGADHARIGRQAAGA